MKQSETNNSTLFHHCAQRLISNGYTPLPLHGKAPKGILKWSTIDTTTAEFIERTKPHPRATNPYYDNTGIRCDDLIVFDIDVVDQAMVDDIADIIEDRCGLCEMYRIGKDPKAAMVYRRDGPPGVNQRSGKYGDHMVELFTNSGKQFAAFGIHPDTGLPYYWENWSPLTMTIDDVTPLDVETALSTMEEIEKYLVSTGLPKVSTGYSMARNGPSTSDLTDDFEIWPVDMEQPTTWGALKALLTTDRMHCNIRRENGEWGDSGAIHAYIGQGSGNPTLCDFARGGEVHDEQIDASVLDAVLPDEPPGTFFDLPLLDRLLADWVLMADRTVRRLSRPSRSFDLSGLKAQYLANTIPVEQKRGPPKFYPVADVWQKNPNRLVADAAEMRPDLPDDKIFEDDDGTLIFNTYREKQHGPVGGDLETFWDFVEHLIPSDAELDYFLDWHAAKIANPSWRMHALMMIAPHVFGTGRGTWFQILEKLFMPLYVRGIDFQQLTGQGSQGQYNDFMADSLMVCVKESQEQQQSKWLSRHNAYEAFKGVCDTYADLIQIKRKYGHTSYQRTFASFIIASNHPDAFAIEPGDRRLLVIDNCTTPLAEAPGDLMGRILAFKDNPESIATLHHWFIDRWQRGIGHDVFGTPPDTPAKQRMISAGQSDVDDLFDLFVDQAKGDVCSTTQLRRWMVDQTRGGEFELPDGQKFEQALAGILKKRACRFSGNSKWQISVDDVKVRPWIIRNAADWISNPGNDAVRAEILKNGPVASKVLHGDFGKKD